MTVDKPWPGINYESLRGSRKSPADISKYVNFPGIPRTDLKNSAQTWDYVKWLVSQTKLPVILKGVLTARDAVKAAESGVSGVIVSNHGGRLVTITITIMLLCPIAPTVKTSLPPPTNHSMGPESFTKRQYCVHTHENTLFYYTCSYFRKYWISPCAHL